MSHSRAGTPIPLLHRQSHETDSAPQAERAWEPWLCLIGGAGNPASLKEWEPWLCLKATTERNLAVSQGRASNLALLSERVGNPGRALQVG